MALNFSWIRTTVSSSYAGEIFLDYDATRVRGDAQRLEVFQVYAGWPKTQLENLTLFHPSLLASGIDSIGLRNE